MSEYQGPLPFFGGPFVPPPLAPRFAQSPRNTPHPWRNYSPFRDNIVNNVGLVGPQPILPQQAANGYEANAPPLQGGLSAILKQILGFRIAHPDSEVVGFHTETGDNGKVRITVTFETAGGM